MRQCARASGKQVWLLNLIDGASHAKEMELARRLIIALGILAALSLLSIGVTVDDYV